MSSSAQRASNCCRFFTGVTAPITVQSTTFNSSCSLQRHVHGTAIPHGRRRTKVQSWMPRRAGFSLTTTGALFSAISSSLPGGMLQPARRGHPFHDLITQTLSKKPPVWNCSCGCCRRHRLRPQPSPPLFGESRGTSEIAWKGEFGI